MILQLFHLSNSKNSIFIYSLFILIILELGISIYLVNQPWTNKFLETIGLSMLSGLLVSFYRDMALNNIQGMLLHFYIITLIVSLSLIFIGAISQSQNQL